METSTNPPGRFYNHHWEHSPDSPYYKYGGAKEFAGNEYSPEYTPFLKGWSAAKQIREGDLLLYYCTAPKQDIRYLMRRVAMPTRPKSAITRGRCRATMICFLSFRIRCCAVR